VCTVLLRFSPGAPWPVLVGAVRDEFTDRAWDPPACHWPDDRAHLVGGRDHTAGGTWLAVDPNRPALAALLNGFRLPLLEHGTRPTRGDLALRILADGTLPDDLTTHDRFHLLRATLDAVEVWTWDGDDLVHHLLAPGTHVVVNAGLDTDADPLVPHFAPLLAALSPPDEDLAATRSAWIHLLSGDGLDPGDPRALLVRREVDGRPYASTSATFVGLSAGGAHYEFTATPQQPSSWDEVKVPATERQDRYSRDRKDPMYDR